MITTGRFFCYSVSFIS